MHKSVKNFPENSGKRLFIPEMGVVDVFRLNFTFNQIFTYLDKSNLNPLQLQITQMH